MTTKRTEMRKRVGLRIRHLRKAHKMNQAELAELLGISTPAISYIERGRNLPADRVVQIASVFQVSADSLLSEEADNA